MLDLDNTIIDYDEAFGVAAVALGLVTDAAGLGKTALRDRIRALPDGEARWMHVQAEVYGPGIRAARLFPGVREFLEDQRMRGIPVAIVSHKTEFAAAGPGGPNLRACARSFLTAQQIDVPVYFEATRTEKCGRIATLAPSHVIDDLIDVFADPAFPPGIRRWLFAPHGARAHRCVDRRFATWSELRRAVALC